MAKLVNAQIKFSTAQAKKVILPAIAVELNKLVQSNIKRIKSEAQLIIEEEIKAHDTYKALISDDPNELGAELGVNNAYSKIQSIIHYWIRSLEINVNPVVARGTRLSGGFTLQAIRSDFEDVIDLDEAHHLAELKHGRAFVQSLQGGEFVDDIRWLEWLLVKGFDAHVYNFEVSTDLGEGNSSRTGLAVMKVARGNIWMVPPRHAGTIDDNWITQAMEDAAHKIQSIIAILISTEVSAPARIV